MAKATRRRCPACGKVKSFRADQKTCGCKSVAVLDASARETFLRKEVKRLQTALEKSRETEGFQQEIADRIASTIAGFDPLPILPYKTSGAKAEAEMAAVLQLGDWHIGERISPAETGGFGQYDYSLAQERIDYITDKFLGWIGSHRGAFKIPKIYIFGQADWVTGSIHKELVEGDGQEFAPPEAAVRSGELLARVVGKIAPHAPEVHLIEIEADNHGRLDAKPRFKGKARNNWSFVTYAMANALLAKHGNVDIVNGHRIRELVNVQGVKFLVEHGDVVKSWQGVPYPGMLRHAGKEANKHMRAMLQRQRQELSRLRREYGFDYVALGHFHVPNVIDKQILVNGSLSGTSEFDEGVGRYADPAQVSFMVHPKYGIFDWTPWGVKR